VNELVRRADPQHRSLGTILREDIGPKLGAEVYFNLPKNLEHRFNNNHVYPRDRLLLSLAAKTAMGLDPAGAHLVRKLLFEPDSITFKAVYSIPKYAEPHPNGDFGNCPEVRRSENPSFGGQSNALSVRRGFFSISSSD
jgi:hypothetical protein